MSLFYVVVVDEKKFQCEKRFAGGVQGLRFKLQLNVVHVWVFKH